MATGLDNQTVIRNLNDLREKFNRIDSDAIFSGQLLHVPMAAVENGEAFPSLPMFSEKELIEIQFAAAGLAVVDKDRNKVLKIMRYVKIYCDFKRYGLPFIRLNNCCKEAELILLRNFNIKLADDFRLSQKGAYWWNFVFELAWSNVNLPIEADRFSMDKRNRFTRWCHLKEIPEAYVSYIDNLATASKHAIDWLLKLKQYEAQKPQQAGASKAVAQQADSNPDKNGYIKYPIDKKAYKPASEILASYCGDLIVAPTAKTLSKIVENFTDNHIRWTRPISVNDKPMQNRRNIHLTDWLDYVNKQTKPAIDSDGFPVISEAEIGQRTAQVKTRKYGK